MNDLNLAKQNFESSIENIDALSKKNKNLPALQKFKEKDGPMDIFRHTVKGEEMNEFASQVQDNLMLLNEKTNQFYMQFVEVYKAFDTLNKDYIAAILHTFNQAIEATKKAEDAQKDINKTIDILQKTIIKIKEFNEKVDAELSRIDPNNWQSNATTHKKELETLDNKAYELMQTIESYKAQHYQLVKELHLYKEEKIKYNRNMKLCWITSGSLFFLLLSMIIYLL